MKFDITKRLRETPFGTESSERLLMAQAADEIDILRQDNDRLEDENGELRYEPWPKWAKDVLHITRKRSGYDGYDDDSEGVDLPAELEECFGEIEAEDEKQRKLIDTLRADNERLRSALKAILGAETHLLHCGYDDGPGGGNYVYKDVIRTDDETFALARAALSEPSQ